jgi:phosphatidylglycerol:prolipoprotein diacylglycerol transferase
LHPYLLHLGHFYLATFGVLAAVGLLLGLLLSQRTAMLTGVAPDALWDAGVFAILSAYVLSRVLFALTNVAQARAFPLLLLAVPSLTPLGLLLAGVATIVWLRFKRVQLLPALDAWAPCGTLIWAFLALGHFAEGSDPGMPAGRLPGIVMPGESTPLHPVALYVACGALLLTLVMYRRLRAMQASYRKPGEMLAVTLMAAGGLQFLLSFIRQPGQTFWLGLDDLEWVALAMIASGGVIVALLPAESPDANPLPSGTAPV